MRKLFAVALAIGLGSAVPAAAAVFVITPGPEGEDSSPYSFLPFLNRGQYETLYVFDGSGGDANHTFETYLRFELPPQMLQTGETVTAAYLVVTYAYNFTGYGDTTGTPGAVRVHRVDGAWSEAGLTWVTRPLLGPALDEVGGITAFGPIEFDVTLAVRDWALGISPNQGIALIPAARRVLGLYSFEADYGTGPGQIDPALRATLVVATGPGGPPDADADGYLDAADNCPYAPNNQLDNGGVGSFSANGIGNACECGDTSDDGSVQPADVTDIRERLAGLPGSLAAPEKCSVQGPIVAADGPDADALRDDCQVDDVVVIRRALAGRGPGIGQLCDPATP
jgi:hypothetical protein